MRDRIERSLAYAKGKQAEEKAQIEESVKNENEYLAEFYRQREAYWRGEVNAFLMMLTFVITEENEQERARG